MFCLNYYPYSDYLKDAQELKIKYDKINTILEDFLQQHQNQTIVIDVTDNFDEIDARLFKGLKEKFNNFKLIIKYENSKEIELVKKNQLPFFFCNFATSIDKMYGLMKYCPTDMYICEELGFNLKNVAEILHQNNILLRTFPNICQTSFPETDGILTFFIRPEDIPIYSQFIDVFQLVSDEARQAVIFKIYKQQKWFGELSEIIPTFKEKLNGKYILNDFAIFRTNCGKRCMYRPKSCNICTRIMELANSFKENNIVLLPEN